MNDEGSLPASVDDRVFPFLLPTAGVRGRLVRLGPAAEEILTRHDYEPAVAQLLAELMVLAAGLGSFLKFEGLFTLQTRSEGAVRLMVADITSEGGLRAYAEADRAAVEAVTRQEPRPSLPRLTGPGYLAFTVDPKEQENRYQGIVALEGERLADCFIHYFRQSEQLPSAIHVAARKVEGRWRAAGLILQRLPVSEHAEEGSRVAEAREEGWRRATALMSTLSDDELLDPGLPASSLVWRLFNEEEIETHEERPVVAACRCSREKVERVLVTLTDEELSDLKTEGRVEVTCQFCSRRYDFDDADLAALRQG